MSERITLTPHIGGLVLDKPLDSMDSNTCIVMDNLIPEVDGDRLRPGFKKLNVPIIPDIAPDWGAGFISGNKKHLIAHNANNGTLYALTEDGEYINSAPMLSNDITTAQFTDGGGGQLMFICDGSTPIPMTYNGISFANAGFNNPNGYILVNPLAYKNRMYFVRKNSTQILYGGLQAMMGGLDVFDVSSFMQRGGNIVGLANWRQNSSVGIQNTLAIITSEGEVLVYSGTDPTQQDWQLNGVYSIPRPIGNRFYENFAGDVVIATENGVFMLSQILPQDGQNISRISDVINPIFFKNPNILGIPTWLRTLGLLIVNYDKQTQYALCVRTGGWCRLVGYKTSVKFIELGQNMYFMSPNGIMKITPDSFTDNGADINWYKQGAYLKANDGTVAQILRVMPWVDAETNIQIYRRILTDFKGEGIGIVAQAPSTGVRAEWDLAKWDESYWSQEGMLEKYKGLVTSFPARFNSVGYFGHSNVRLRMMSSELTVKIGTGDT